MSNFSGATAQFPSKFGGIVTHISIATAQRSTHPAKAGETRPPHHSLFIKRNWRTQGLALLVGCLGWFGCSAIAASWSMGGAIGHPGDVVHVAIKFKGDGSTAGMDASWILDEARFTIDAPPGPLSGANGGQCAWNGTNTITALVFATTGVLPSTSKTMCTVPLKIRDNAVVGGAAIRAKSFSCANGAGASSPCTAEFAYIVVLGDADAHAAVLPPSQSLSILLDAKGPTVEEVLDMAAKGEAALATFREVPPVAVRSLVSQRSTGEARDRLAKQPFSADGVLERYIVAEYANMREREIALQSARGDPQVRSVNVDENMAIGGIGGVNPVVDKSVYAKTVPAYSQYHLDMLGIAQAWSVAGGWGLVGMPDNGIDPNHPELRTFTGTDSVGGTFVPSGNYLPGVSRNHGGQGQPANDLREMQKALAQPSDAPCDAGNTGYITPAIAGHGTHVAGLVAANADDAQGSTGTCRHCGLAIRKVSGVSCVQTGNNVFTAYPAQESSAVADAMKDLRRVGVQVISASFGSDPRYCTNYVDDGEDEDDAMCAALGGAIEDDVVVVAAVGNNLAGLNFPAADQSVVAVGGLNEVGERWNYLALPGGVQNCPYYDPVTNPTSRIDCGSNASTGTVGPAGHRKI